MSRAASAKVTKSCSAIRCGSRRSSVQSADIDRNIICSPSNLRPRPKTAWKKSDLQRMEAANHAITLEEKQKLFEKNEAEKQRLEQESHNRKRSLQELDAMRDEIFGQHGDPYAEEKAEMDSKLLNRALLARHEQVKLKKKICYLKWNA